MINYVMILTADSLIKEFTIPPDSRDRKLQSLSDGISWMKTRGCIHAIVDSAKNIPLENNPYIGQALFPVIVISRQSMYLAREDNGIITGWDGDPGLLPPKLIIGRTTILIGEELSPNNIDKVTILVPREKANCLRAICDMKYELKNRFTTTRRVSF